MKKFLLIFLATFLAAPLFFVYAEDDVDPYIFIQGKNEYERNGVMSFTSEEEPVLTLTSSVTDEITVDVYASNKDDLLEYLKYDGEHKQINDEPRVHTDAKIETRTVHAGDKFPLTIDKEGIYVVHAYAGDTENYAFVVRSRVGIVVKESRDGLIFWAQEYASRRKMPHVNIAVYGVHEKVEKKEETKTGEDGAALTKTSVTYDIAVATYGKSIALIPLNLSRLGRVYYEGEERTNDYPGQELRAKYFTFIDRPLYRPGDTVHFKSVARYDDDLSYRLPDDGTWHVSISHWGENEKKVVAEGDYKTDSYGTLSGDLVIPSDASYSDGYELTVERTDKKDLFEWWGWNASSVYFSVQEYRKPEYDLSIHADQRDYVSGGSVSFDVEARYFSGEAIKGGSVQYKIYESPYYESLYYEDRQDESDLRMYSYGGYGEIASGIVSIGADGTGQGAFAPMITDGLPHVYTVEVQYAAEAGEPVIDQEYVMVYPAEYGIYRTDYVDTALAGKEYATNMILHPNRDGAVIADQNMHIVIERTWWEEKDDQSDVYNRYEEHVEIIKEFDATSDRSGHVTVDFIPPAGGSYEISISGTDQFGNHVIKIFNAWITEDKKFIAGQNSEGLTIATDQSMYEPGSRMDINVSAETGDRDLFVTLEREFVHEYHVIHMDGSDEDFDLTIDDDAMPQITLGVQGFDRAQLNAAQKKIVVSAQTKKLNVSLSTDRVMYGPGDTVTVNIMAKDDKGKPQRADLALWAIDKAIFELKEPSSQDIFATFWGESARYGFTQSSNSLRSISIESAESGGCFVAGTQVRMSDGTKRAIEDIHVGDLVMTRSEKSEELISARVTSTHMIDAPGYFEINNGLLRVTGEHIVRVNDTWKTVYDLRVGDMLVGHDGEDFMITSLKWIGERISVYNFEVEEYHAYFANDVFVHNNKGEGPERGVFKDVAYWDPHVRTDDSGKARVTFVLPDDLTTWVISGIGTTQDTQVGNAMTEVMTTKPIMVRPYMPNILRKDDQLSVVATIQNTTAEDRTLTAQLSFDGGDVETVRKDVTVVAGGTEVVSWKIVPKKEGADAVMVFAAVDQKDPTLGDKVEKHIPIKQYGFDEKNSYAHADGAPYDVMIPDDAYNDKTYIELTVASSLLHSLRGAMTYLIRYPYGCVEQITSSMVPAILAKERTVILREAAEGKDLDAMIIKGVKMLEKRQNDEGGWELWGGDSSELFLSSYVVEQLKRAQAVGVPVDEEVLSQAQGYFDRQDAALEDERILVAYGRSLFGSLPDGPVSVNVQTPADLLAMGVIANLRSGFTDPQTNGYEALLSRLQKQGNVVFLASGDPISYFSSDDTSTALALRAVLMAQGDQEIIRGLTQYLTQSRKKEYWSHTFATSQTLMALTAYAHMEQGEKHDGVFRVMVDGTEIAHDVLSDAQPVVTVNVPVEKIKKSGSKISIISEGKTYSTIFTNAFHTDRDAKAMSRGIGITRSYQNEKGKEYSIGVGDTVIVSLEVSGLQPGMRNMLLEDHLPSGMIPVNESFVNADMSEDMNAFMWTEHREYLLDGVIITDTHPSNETYMYRARVVSAGEFAVPPAYGVLMYSPDIYGRTEAQNIHIDVASQVVEVDGSIKKSKAKDQLASFMKNLTSVMTVIAIGACIVAICVGVFAAIKYKKGS